MIIGLILVIIEKLIVLGINVNVIKMLVRMFFWIFLNYCCFNVKLLFKYNDFFLKNKFVLYLLYWEFFLFYGRNERKMIGEKEDMLSMLFWGKELLYKEYYIKFWLNM